MANSDICSAKSGIKAARIINTITNNIRYVIKAPRVRLIFFVCSHLTKGSNNQATKIPMKSGATIFMMVQSR